MARQYPQALQLLCQCILIAEPGLKPNEIREDASLSWDLGLDSMRLASVLRELVGHGVTANVEEWVLEADLHGGDTVGSLARFIAEGGEGRGSPHAK